MTASACIEPVRYQEYHFYLASNVNFRLQEQRNSARAVWTSQLRSCSQKLLCLKKISLKQFNLRMKISLVKYILFISCVCFLFHLLFLLVIHMRSLLLFIVVYRFWSCDLLRREIILSEKARSCFPWFLELTARVDSHVIIVSDYFPVWSFDVISIFKAPNTYNSSKTTSHQNCFRIWSLHLMGGSIMNVVFGACREQN